MSGISTVAFFATVHSGMDFLNLRKNCNVFFYIVAVKFFYGIHFPKGENMPNYNKTTQNVKFPRVRKVSVTTYYGYPCYKLGDWKVIKNVRSFWGEVFSLVSYQNNFKYLTRDGDSLEGSIIYGKPNDPDSRNVGYLGVSPRQIIKLLTTPISPEEKYWYVLFSDPKTKARSERIFPNVYKLRLPDELSRYLLKRTY
jgi:hypothetical protein